MIDQLLYSAAIWVSGLVVGYGIGYRLKKSDVRAMEQCEKRLQLLEAIFGQKRKSYLDSTVSKPKVLPTPPPSR